MSARAAFCLLALCASPPPAHAGNHFILEMEAGLASPLGLDEALSVESGGVVGGTFGVGGRLGYPAYYLTVGVSTGRFSYHGPARAGSPLVEQDRTEWRVGGRVYLPLSERLRLHLGAGFGETHHEACVSREGFRALNLVADTATLFGEVGLQARVYNHLSFGFVANAALYPETDELDFIARAARLSEAEPGRVAALLLTTLHF
ncbi:hypothetical protein KKB55_02975 [Myxococcota bacterium]|nr:hypothetical protein [Myxococcota bacterium]MBU1896715.1 hypothetical protein [Myxococcota bacterium]